MFDGLPGGRPSFFLTVAFRTDMQVGTVRRKMYIDYNLVMATIFGNPIGEGAIRSQLKKLIEDYNLPPVVFHSFRHSSVTY